jgi:hypothetical protein
MALGPYNHPGTIGETALDHLLSQYNALLSTPFGVSVTDSINSALFPTGAGKIPYQSDTSTGGVVTLAPNTHVFLEYGNTGSSSIDFNTNGAPALIVLGATNSMNFVDNGSSTDVGDTIVGSGSASQYIAVSQGANLVIAGIDSMGVGGLDTLVAGSNSTSDDSLYGSGRTLMEGSSAGNVHMLGGIYATAHDTLMGGSGTDRMKVKAGENTIVAGSGADTITSLDRGNNGTGGDMISLTAGGTAVVNIGTVNTVGGATDTVVFGGTMGNDTINAHGNVVIDVQSSESLTGISQTDVGGTVTTTLSFADNQTLTYSGSGNVTLHFGA